jgi:hypothetical protein
MYIILPKSFNVTFATKHFKELLFFRDILKLFTKTSMNSNVAFVINDLDPNTIFGVTLKKA